jgi:hypothetical protein
MTVFVVRRDGFNEDIQLALKDAAPGFAIQGGRLPAGADKVRLTLSAPTTPSDLPVSLKLSGSAVVQGKEIRKDAVAADDMMQAFAYQHLVPAQDWMVAVIGRANRGMAVVPPDKPIQLLRGATVEFRFTGPNRPAYELLQVTMSQPPEGVTVESITPDRQGYKVVLKVDALKAKPGTKGNLIFEAFVERAQPNAKPGAPKRRAPAGTLPAVMYEIPK